MKRRAKRKRIPPPPGGLTVSGLVFNLADIVKKGGTYTLYRFYRPVAKITVEPIR
jgi:hypothetical protein